MNKVLILIFVSFVFLSCKSNKNKKQIIEKEKQTQKKNKTEQKEAIVIVENKSDYSEKFINGLKKMNGFGDFKLSNNYLILNNKDTIEFPKRPEINKRIVLTAIKDNLAIALIVKRINQVTIEYRLEMTKFGKASYKINGIAEINPSFFLGSESDTFSATGTSYFSTTYQSNEKNGCFNYIRLGSTNDRKYLLGKIIKNCNGEIKDITLENFPTLREK
jgi:hypothetical protein